MTNEQYHSDTSRISKSGLDLIRRSPAHYYAHYLAPERQARKESPALHIGSATHCAILEPEKFDAQYYCMDDARIVAEIGGKNPRATSKYKEWANMQAMLNEGRTALALAEYDAIQRMKEAVHAHPSARLLLQTGIAESTVLFEEPFTGAPCKCRPDWLDEANSLVVDLKTTDDASPEGFGKPAYKYRYHVQAPFYFDGLLASNSDFMPQGFVFIAVEKAPPYNVGVYYAPREVMELGREQYLQDLEVYMSCRASGIWHGYSGELVPLRLPGWAFRSI